MEMYNFFYWLAVPTTIVFLFLTFSSMIGLSDSDVDTDFDSDVDLDFPILTIKNLFGFLTMFSWVGMTCISYEFGVAIALLISTLSGIGLVLLTTTLYFMMNKLKQNTDSSIKSAIGKEGTIHLRVSNKKKGQVSVIINGSLQTVDAISKNGSFENGDLVKIVGASDTILTVDSITNK